MEWDEKIDIWCVGVMLRCPFTVDVSQADSERLGLGFV